MSKQNESTLKTGALVAGAAVLAAAQTSRAALSEEAFLNKVQSEDATERRDAWMQAGEQNPAVIAKLGPLVVHTHLGVAQAAEYSLTNLVNAVGKDPEDPRRGEVVQQLMQLFRSNSQDVQVLSLRLLSHVASENEAEEIARFINVPGLCEEAVYCLERIPGEKATQALVDSMDQAPSHFQQRILTALGFRDDSVGLEALGRAMESPDVDTALTAMKSIARIGKRPPVGRPPQLKEGDVTARQFREYCDCYLRICDAYIASESYERPLEILGKMQSDIVPNHEHIHSAVLVCLSGIPRAEAARMAIEQMETHPSYIVKDTAKKALISMKGSQVDSVIDQAISNANGDVKEMLESVQKARA